MPDIKITADHLRRDAYLYVRQSTLRQVAENGESTQRQYALRDRAAASGWPTERIHVIDCDLGKSGSSAATRDGFQELVSEVALNKAGIVMGDCVARIWGTKRAGVVLPTHLLFKRHGHSSGVRTPTSGSGQRQQWQPQSPRSGRFVIEAHRRLRVCIGRSSPRLWPADCSRWLFGSVRVRARQV
jgi:hypothetical protein